MPSFEINGIRIAFQEAGVGEPLLLIMGLGAPGSVWENHLAVYQKHFRCIVMDNRGAGESDKPEGPYTTSSMADDAAGLLDRLGIESARIAGISMGSAIAQELALKHPAKVRSMILISSWARCDTYMKEIFLHFQAVSPHLSPGDFTRLLQLWIFAPKFFVSNFETLERDKAIAIEGMPNPAFAAQCQACISHYTLERLESIAQPCLLTVGDKDIFTPLRFSVEMAERLPNARLEVFPGTGHCHHWESLTAFNELTLDYLLKH